MITVSKDNSSDFASIQAAIDSVPEGKAETIYIKKGTYKERVEITKDNITLMGEDRDEVIITEGYYANMIMPDGTKRGTFRSYTFYVFADNFKATNITFENSAGFGYEVGQAIAVYAEGDHIHFKNCKLLGHQDTLFTGPLPLKEKQPGGFLGPTQFAPRRHVRQFYEDCYIEGEIDFIFGSATAYFLNCRLYALNREVEDEFKAFYTAPSTYEDQEFGYVFENCNFTGNCPVSSVALGRPWRNYAKTVLLRCEISDQVVPEGFNDWRKADSHSTTFFAEYKCFGPGYQPNKRAAYVHQLDDTQAARYTKDNILGSDFN